MRPATHAELPDGRALTRRRIRWLHRCLCCTVGLLLLSTDVVSHPIEKARAYIDSVRTQPSQVETARLPNGCSEDTLTLFRQSGTIRRVEYHSRDACATEQSFQLDQFFDLDGGPVYVAFRICPGLQSECVVGQLYFANRHVVRVDQFRIVTRMENGHQTIAEIPSATGNGLPLCTQAEIVKQQGIGCAFPSAAEAERYLKTRLANENLEGMFATVSRGTWRPLPFQREWEARINAHNVRLRQKPSKTAPVLEHLFPFAQAVVIEKGIEGAISPWGLHPWYRVKAHGKTGWVFGAFLDPVVDEKMLEGVETERWPAPRANNTDAER